MKPVHESTLEVDRTCVCVCVCVCHYLQQQHHVGFGELLAVQRARSQTNHGHVAHSRVSVGYTGQDLADGETSDTRLSQTQLQKVNTNDEQITT